MLIALSWTEHIHNPAARKWFASNRQNGWATCPLTQAAFVRLSVQPPIVGSRVSVAQAVEALNDHCRDPFHHFFPQLTGLTEMLPEIQERVSGHQQIADAILLDLAIRNRARLVTFDRRMRGLMPTDSPHRNALEIIQTD